MDPTEVQQRAFQCLLFRDPVTCHGHVAAAHSRRPRVGRQTYLSGHAGYKRFHLNVQVLFHRQNAPGYHLSARDLDIRVAQRHESFEVPVLYNRERLSIAHNSTK